MRKEKAYVLGVAQTRFRKEYRAERRNNKIKRFFTWLLIPVAAIFCAALLCFSWTECFDSGMDPGISTGEIVVSNRLAFLINGPERGEVISFNYEDSAGNTKVLQRRVIAFGGETVEIYGGSIYVDGAETEETYTDDETNVLMTVTVPEGCYFVLADNRDEGPDSRDGLYVSESEIVGSVLLAFTF